VGEPARKTDHPYTYGEYSSWPDDERWELIDGVAWNMSPAPSPLHQRVLAVIVARLEVFLEGNPCTVYPAPFDVLLPEREDQAEEDVPTVVQPDVSVICDLTKLTERGCTGAPDLIIEILSPSTHRKDIEIKMKLYERHGVREYWIVDPGNRFIDVYVLQGSGTYPDEPVLYLYPGAPQQTTLASMVLKNFKLDLSEVFRG